MTTSNIYPRSSVTDSFLDVSRANHCRLDNAWAVILAGGDGLPRRAIIPSYLRGQRPSHFCRTANSDFVINQTRQQVSRAIPPERTMVAVSENHLRYAKEVLGDVPSKNIILEPQDDGTTFAMLYSLLRVREKDRNATVVFFPPDLSVPDPRSFMARVQDAIDAVDRQPRLILLGVEPAGADPNREWIEPDMSLPAHENLNVWPVLRFRDTISRSDARELMKRGGLWNSSVIVGKIWMFLGKIRRARPDIYKAFEAAEAKIGTSGEASAMRRVYYNNYTESDFSRDVLQKSADQLAVIPVAAAKVKAVGRVSPKAARSLHRKTTFEAIGATAARA